MRTSFGNDLEFPPFYYKIEKYSIVYIDHNFSIHSSVDGHVGCFRVLPIANSASMKNRIHVFLSTLVSSRFMSRSGIAGSYHILVWR